MTRALAPELEPFAWVRVYASGKWQPADHAGEGEFCKLLPIRDAKGEVIDVAAWRFGEPSPWWLLHGRATFAGHRALEAAVLDNRALRCVETPTAWLRDRGEALVVLDWARVGLRGISSRVRLVPESVALAKRMRHRIAEERQRVSA